MRKGIEPAGGGEALNNNDARRTERKGRTEGKDEGNMKGKKWLCLLMAGWMALAAPALTAFAKPATFKEYKLVKMRNLPYDFVKGGKDGPNEDYFNVGRYAKDGSGGTYIKWGLMEKETLKLIWPCQYVGAGADSEGAIEVLSTEGDGLVLLYPGNKGGALLGDLKGRKVASYDGVSYQFSNPSYGEKAELIAVEKDGKWGAVDYRGREVLPCRYGSAPLFREGIAQVYDTSLNQYIFINTKGERLFADNAELENCEEQLNPSGFYHGVFVIQRPAENGPSQYGVIDNSGELVVPFGQYDEIAVLQDGNLLVGNDYYEGYPGMNLKKYGVITTEGETVVPLQYKSIQQTNDGNGAIAGVYLVEELKTTPAPGDEIPWDAPVNYYLYRQGEGIITPPSDEPLYPHTVDGKYRYTLTTEEGTFIVDEDFEKLAGPFMWANWSGQLSGVLGMHDKDRYFVMSLEGKEGILDKNCKEILAPTTYDSLYFSSGGVMVASKDGKYGVIRETGEVLVDFQYDDMSAIYLQPFGLRVFCACLYEDDGLSSWEAQDGRTDKWWLISEDGEILSDLNGGLYGWGGGYVKADYVISVSPYRPPAQKMRTVPMKLNAPLLRTAAVPLADDTQEEEYEPAMEYYTAQRVADYQLEDEASGVQVTAPPDSIREGTTLSVQTPTAGADYDAVKAALPKDEAEDFRLYDLALMRDDTAVEPSGGVKVSLPLPEDAAYARVYRVEEDGTLIPVQTELKDGLAIFETDRMGKFVLVPTENPATGGALPAVGFAAVLALPVSAGAVLLLYRSRKSRI